MRTKPTLILALALFAAGCSRVHVKTPVGGPEAVYDAEEIDGQWLLTLGGDEPRHFAVSAVLRPDHTILTAAPEWDEEEEIFTVTTATQHVIRVAGHKYLQLNNENGVQLLHLTEPKPGQLAFHLPDAPAFTTAVKDGKLKGSVDDRGGVHLDDGRALRVFLETNGPRPYFKREPSATAELISPAH